MTANRVVSWGAGLVVEAHYFPRGLNGAVDLIRGELGPMVGSRNTFAKLQKADSPDGLDEVEQFRAWLLLAVFGQDPAGWGISDEIVPPAYGEPAALAARLRARVSATRRGTTSGSYSTGSPRFAPVAVHPAASRQRRTFGSPAKVAA